MKLFKVLAMIAALSGASLTLSACRESDTENAIEDAGEKVEDAGDAVGDKVEDAGDAAEDAVD